MVAWVRTPPDTAVDVGGGGGGEAFTKEKMVILAWLCWPKVTLKLTLIGASCIPGPGGAQAQVAPSHCREGWWAAGSPLGWKINLA